MEGRQPSDLPVVCTLTPGERRERRQTLLPGLLAQAEAQETLDEGYRFRFAPSGDVLRRIADTIGAERQCCRFLRFQLVIEPGLGPIWLEVTGPAGTRAFLAEVGQQDRHR